MRPRTFVLVVAILSVAHLTLALGSFAITFSFGMERFDAGLATDRSPLEAMASTLTDVLWQPMLTIWHAIFVGRSGPSLLQWSAVVINSVLWGVALASLFVVVRARLQAR